MSRKYILLTTLLGFVFAIGVSHGIPVESTTVKILVPPPSSSADDSDDAIIIEAGDSAGTVDEVHEFNAADCLLPKSKGPCRAVIDSWFYSTVTKFCEPFAWSGCGGNNNRFSEKAFCETHCSKEKLTGQAGSSASGPTKPSTPVLFPGSEVNGRNNSNTNCPEFDGCGPLKCAVTTDPVTGCQKCECASGANGPESDGETPAAKLPVGSVSGNPELEGTTGPKKAEKPEDVCHLPETRGNCRAMMTRWRYNPEIKECVQFHFGGCDGNTNNFVNKEKCTEFCKGQ